MSVCGIYVIWNRNNKCYVGSSKDVGRRWKQHWDKLLRGSHENRNLQDDWIQLGAREFRFDLLEEVEPGKLLEREEFFIRQLRSFAQGYNATPDGQGDPRIPGRLSHGISTPESVTPDQHKKPLIIVTPPGSPDPIPFGKKGSPHLESKLGITVFWGTLVFLVIVVSTVLILQFETNRVRSANPGKQSREMWVSPREDPLNKIGAAGEHQMMTRDSHDIHNALEQPLPRAIQVIPQPKARETRLEIEGKERFLSDTANYKGITVRTYGDGSYLVAYYDNEGNKHVSNSSMYLPAEIMEVLE